MIVTRKAVETTGKISRKSYADGVAAQNFASAFTFVPVPTLILTVIDDASAAGAARPTHATSINT